MSRLIDFWFISVLVMALPLSAFADVNVSQSYGYSVIGPPDGVNVNQATGYTVIGPPDGINVNQATAYTVIGPPDGINVNQAAIYVVIGPPTATPQPSVFIFTKNFDVYSFPAVVPLTMLLGDMQYYLKPWSEIAGQLR